MNKSDKCKHGFSLPKGLSCDKDYIQVRLLAKAFGKRGYYKNFGPHTKESQEIAQIHLNDKRKELMLGRAGMAVELPQKRFKDVCKLWFPLWCKQTDGDGKPLHGAFSQYERKRTLDRELIPAFGDLPFDEIKTPEIESWREKLVKRGLSGTTVNRYQGPLSAIFTDTTKWVEAGKIKPAFRVPVKNPCLSATWAKNKVRGRLLDSYELKKLKLAFTTLSDLDGWEIVKLALKSVLSLKDLKTLEKGHLIDLERSKTGVPINIPLKVLVSLNWRNWRKRWEAGRAQAGLSDIQFRDLRKTGINMITGKHDTKLVSQFAGHASVKTTEGIYTQIVQEKMRPLAEDLEQQVEAI